MKDKTTLEGMGSSGPKKETGTAGGTMPMDRFKLLIGIVDRGRGSKVVDLFRSHHLHFDFACLGSGTASSIILSYFGLDETAKELVWTLSPCRRVPAVLREAKTRLKLEKPGSGILFSIPLSAISGQIPPVLIKPEYSEEDINMDTSQTLPKEKKAYELVLTIANRGFTDHIMEAARGAGAKGGTVILARRVGYEDDQNLLGFTLQPEKEIIAILVPKEDKLPVMRAINREAGLKTECRGILFSLPVDDILGLQE